MRSVRPGGAGPDRAPPRAAHRPDFLCHARVLLDARGLPEAGTGLAGHDIVVYDNNGFARSYRRDVLCGEPARGRARGAGDQHGDDGSRKRVAAGLGIGEVPTHLARRFPSLVRVWPERAEPYDMWLVMHGDLKRTARVRAVADAVVEAFEREEA